MFTTPSLVLSSNQSLCYLTCMSTATKDDSRAPTAWSRKVVEGVVGRPGFAVKFPSFMYHFPSYTRV